MTQRPDVGTRLVFRWTKWGGSPHWEHDCVYLGSDRYGDWVGQRDGWRSARPGLDTVSQGDNVTLIPPGGEYTATFNETHPRIAVYIDVAWDVRWDTGVPTGIDMDLDVVRARDGRGVFIDDRDEWEEHRVAYGYPLEVVARLEQVALDLEAQVTARTAPFDDDTSGRWLALLQNVDFNGDR